MNQTPAKRRPTPAVWVATGLGVGLVAPAPGTVGALWGLPWAWWIVSGAAPSWAWATVLAGMVLGIPLCTRAARDLGGEKDPGAIVWDEIATVPLVFLPYELWIYAHSGEPFATGRIGANPFVCFLLLALGFGWHRFFDILKFPPCRRLERLHGGLGIMLDDVMAALYAGVALILSIHILMFAFVMILPKQEGW